MIKEIDHKEQDKNKVNIGKETSNDKSDGIFEKKLDVNLLNIMSVKHVAGDCVGGIVNDEDLVEVDRFYSKSSQDGSDEDGGEEKSSSSTVRGDEGDSDSDCEDGEDNKKMKIKKKNCCDNEFYDFG